jgi:chromosome segregation ATPase
MTTAHKPTLIIACLALAFAAALAWAQSPTAKSGAKPAGKTLGGKAPSGGKLMTRDELRSCLKRLEEVNARIKEIDAQRQLLDRERSELSTAGDVLLAERANLDRQLTAVREWEARARAQAVEVENFNKRSAEMQAAPRSQQEKLAKELATDRERLEKSRDTLAADEARLVPSYRAAAATYNERALARDARVTDWNARNGATVDASVKQQEDRALWLNECANRPYLEDDETAIKAGK